MKRRLMLMMTANVLAALSAIAGVVGYFKFELGWGLGVFVAALVTGFAFQIWFVAGFRRTGRGA
jgi:hypothetical protein